MTLINRFATTDADFRQQLDALRQFDEEGSAEIISAVQSILADIRQRGDAAVLEYTAKFDGVAADSLAALKVSAERIQQAKQNVSSEALQALQSAYANLVEYAEQQKLQSWEYTREDGTRLGQVITPLDRVGLYVPGGKAAYPSSVLMNAVPAKVAGVQSITMVVPAPNGVLNDYVLAAADIAGVDEIYTIGGAQAVAALAYGTDTIPAVDKITGPGNIYVATAKQLVFGEVGIDMVAGPSEVVVIADDSANPDWVAMDLFAQAEHDEQAQSLLLSPSGDFLNAVAASIERLLPTMPREAIIATSLRNRGALIQTKDLAEAAEISNQLAPEHLELAVENAAEYQQRIKHAGAIFIGHYAAEAVGDYCAGPNHVLPTARTARFFSPLGTYDFQKRSTILECTASGAAELGKVADVLATGEGLDAHAQSARYRT